MTKQKAKPRPEPTKSERYKVTNWPEYNRSLKERGNLRLWIPAQALDKWYYYGKKEKGGQLEHICYPDRSYLHQFLFYIPISRPT